MHHDRELLLVAPYLERGYLQETFPIALHPRRTPLSVALFAYFPPSITVARFNTPVTRVA